MWLPTLPPCEGSGEKPDLSQIKVFEVQPNQVVILKPDAWHFVPFVTSPGAIVSVLAIFNRTGWLQEGVAEIVQLDEAISIIPP